MTQKKFIISGLSVTLAAVAIVMFSVLTSLGQVSAAELTQQSLDKVTQLSPSQEQRLETRVDANPKSELEAAEHAKDLSILAYDQFKQLQPQASTIAVHGPDGSAPGPDTLNLANLKYLKYTDASGATHIIGVDKNGLPALVMVFSNKNGMRTGSVQITGSAGEATPGTTTVTGTTASGTSAGNTQPANTSCSNSDGHVTCSTNGVSNPNCQTSSNGMVSCSQSGSATANSKQP